MRSISELNPRLLNVSHMGEGNMPAGYRSFGERVTRWHELDIIPWGNGVDCIMGTDWPVTGGDVFYRTPGLRNRHHLPYHCYFFVFDPYYTPEHETAYGLDDMNCSDNISNDDWEPIPIFSFASQPYLGKAQNLERLILMSRNLLVEFSRTRPDPLLIKIQFLQLLQEIANQFRRTEDLPLHSEEKYQPYIQAVWDIEQWIRTHPTERNSMQEMADRLHVSYSFFSRIFQHITGQNYAAYVAQTRLDSAKLRLMETNKTVAEIALECGYRDPNYLYLAFRRMMGCTPNEYRRLTAYAPESRKKRM